VNFEKVNTEGRVPRTEERPEKGKKGGLGTHIQTKIERGRARLREETLGEKRGHSSSGKKNSR